MTPPFKDCEGMQCPDEGCGDCLIMQANVMAMEAREERER